MNEDRVIELETRLAYQEETLQVLNGVVTRLQKQIEQLELTCRRLSERSWAGGVVRGNPEDEVPPHY